MSNTTNLLFKSLQVVAWVIFIGLCIEAGGFIVNFFFSLYRPDFVQNLYQKLDLTGLYLEDKWAFYQTYSFILIIALLKTYLFYIVVILMYKLNLSKPFNTFTTKQISKISYFTLSIGLLSYIAKESTNSIIKHGVIMPNIDQFWADGQAYILMGAVIYIIATIFKKGVEIQHENDLTV